MEPNRCPICGNLNYCGLAVSPACAVFVHRIRKLSPKLTRVAVLWNSQGRASNILVGSVGHQATSLDKISPIVDCRQSVLCRQGHDLFDESLRSDVSPAAATLKAL